MKAIENRLTRVPRFVIAVKIFMHSDLLVESFHN